MNKYSKWKKVNYIRSKGCDKNVGKEVVKIFFDLKIKGKYNILRLKNLKNYIKQDRFEKILKELQDFNKEIAEYMEIYHERFHRNPIRNNLIESEENNSYLIEKYKKERETIEEFEKKNDFPKGSYPLEFDIFVKDLFNDILELEKLKENQEKIIIEKI